MCRRASGRQWCGPTVGAGRPGAANLKRLRKCLANLLLFCFICASSGSVGSRGSRASRAFAHLAHLGPDPVLVLPLLLVPARQAGARSHAARAPFLLARAGEPILCARAPLAGPSQVIKSAASRAPPSWPAPPRPAGPARARVFSQARGALAARRMQMTINVNWPAQVAADLMADRRALSGPDRHHSSGAVLLSGADRAPRRRGEPAGGEAGRQLAAGRPLAGGPVSIGRPWTHN